jgi:hypothetical protein
VQRLAESVVELLVLFDVESPFEQERRDRLDDAGAFNARQCEHEPPRTVVFREALACGSVLFIGVVSTSVMSPP